jgi:hypothetical protein
MVTMTKLSSSLHEYLCSLKNIHISNNNLNEHWGFFIDIENKSSNSKKIVINNKNYFGIKNSNNRRINSFKSVSNLNEISDIDKETAIFKMDEELEEENNNGKYLKEYKNLHFIGNICMFSTIALLLLLF